MEKKKYWLLLYGLVIGIVFDIFFYNKTLGISYPVSILLLLVIAALIFLRKFSKLQYLKIQCIKDN